MAKIGGGSLLTVFVCTAMLTACDGRYADAGAPAQSAVEAPSGNIAQPVRAEGSSQQGKASWYGERHQGKKMASGEPFDHTELTAAHRTLPLGSKVEVTNVENGKSVEVTVTDRGPYAKNRVIDLSKAAAQALDMTKDGVAPVKVTPMQNASGS